MHEIVSRHLPAIAALAVFPALVTSRAAASQTVPSSGTGRVVVGWDDSAGGTGMLRAFTAGAPWLPLSEPLEVGARPIVRSAFGRLYVFSPIDGTVQVVAPETWTVERKYDLGPGGDLMDIAVVNRHTAYVARANTRQLIRLDLLSGASREAVDLGVFSDADGIPDLGTMTAHDGRLFVQIQRLHPDEAPGYVSPGYLAVVDIASEELVDVDPEAPGMQAIELAGTFPKLTMQVVEQTEQLFVSATGGFFDAGGIEVVDLERLRSDGLVIAEADGLTGADLGPFVMINPQEGFLAYSTDLTISSHLHRFSLADGVDPEELQVAVDYLAPVLQFDQRTKSVFFPVGGGRDNGFHVFDADTGERMSNELIVTGGSPTSLVVLPIPEPASYVLVGAAVMLFLMQPPAAGIFHRAVKRRTSIQTVAAE